MRRPLPWRVVERSAGFTLVELLIVIVILGILAGIVVFAVGNTTTNAEAPVRRRRRHQRRVESYKATPGLPERRPPAAGSTRHDLLDGNAATLPSELLKSVPVDYTIDDSGTSSRRTDQNGLTGARSPIQELPRLSRPLLPGGTLTGMTPADRRVQQPGKATCSRTGSRPSHCWRASASLFMVVGPFFGAGGLVIGLVLGRGVRRRVVLVLRQARRARRRRGTRARRPSSRKLYAIVRDLTSRTGLPMPAIYLSPAAQPNAFATGRNPAPRGRRGHAGPAPGRRRGRAARRARPRAVARREPRHPDHVGRGRGRHGHHVRGPHGDVGRAVRRPRRQRPAQPRRPEHDRRARDDDPRADRGGDAPDGAVPLARVRGRPQRRRAARQRRAAGPRAREDRRRTPSRCR